VERIAVQIGPLALPTDNGFTTTCATDLRIGSGTHHRHSGRTTNPNRTQTMDMTTMTNNTASEHLTANDIVAIEQLAASQATPYRLTLREMPDGPQCATLCRSDRPGAGLFFLIGRAVSKVLVVGLCGLTPECENCNVYDTMGEALDDMGGALFTFNCAMAGAVHVTATAACH
jgi:hypothetical protein